MFRKAPWVLAAAPLVLGLALDAAPGTSKSFSFATYKEKDGPITILVGSFPAALADEEAYVPLQVAVGLRGKDARLTITPESFTLIDPEGRRYPMASYREVAALDRLLTFTAEILRAVPLVTGEQFANTHLVESRFFPPLPGRRVDRVHLRRTTWFNDVVYFPRPDLGLRGVLTLRFRTEEMNRPIDVRFEVPLKGEHRGRG